MPRNKYPEETVEKILQASKKLFLEKGFEETTVLDIVDNLGGLTRGAFYHHFKSKDEVLDALDNKRFYDNNPFEKVRGDSSLSGLEKLKKVVKMWTSNTDQQSIGIMTLPLLKNPRILSKMLEENWSVVLPLFAELFEEGVGDGSINSPVSPNALAELLVMFNFWLLPSVFPCDKVGFLERITTVKRTFDSLGAPIIDDELLLYCEKATENLGLL